MVNNLADNLRPGEDLGLYLEVFFDQLAQYTDYHFQMEEKMMRGRGFPGYDEHKAIHDRLRQQVSDFRQRFVKKEKALSEDLLAFLRDWLVNYILKRDMEMTEFVGK